MNERDKSVFPVPGPPERRIAPNSGNPPPIIFSIPIPVEIRLPILLTLLPFWQSALPVFKRDAQDLEIAALENVHRELLVKAAYLVPFHRSVGKEKPLP